MNQTTALFVGLSLVIQLVLLYAPFDIYYSSPLITGLRPHPITRQNEGTLLKLLVIVID